MDLPTRDRDIGEISSCHLQGEAFVFLKKGNIDYMALAVDLAWLARLYMISWNRTVHI